MKKETVNLIIDYAVDLVCGIAGASVVSSIVKNNVTMPNKLGGKLIMTIGTSMLSGALANAASKSWITAIDEAFESMNVTIKKNDEENESQSFINLDDFIHYYADKTTSDFKAKVDEYNKDIEEHKKTIEEILGNIENGSKED